MKFMNNQTNNLGNVVHKFTTRRAALSYCLTYTESGSMSSLSPTHWLYASKEVQTDVILASEMYN